MRVHKTGTMVMALTLACTASICAGCKTTGAEKAPQTPVSAVKEAGTLVTVLTEKQLARDKELEAQAAFFIDLYTNDSPALSSNGSTIAFVSNREGLSQVYAAPAGDPGKEPARLSDKAERALYPVLSPDGKRVLYVSDAGADERYRIFAAGVDDGGAPECLTPQGDLWRDPPLITDDGAAMLYTAAELKETRTMLYLQPLDAKVPKEVYKVDSRAFLEDITGDGGSALVTVVISFSDTELVLVDTKNAAGRRLYPPEGKKAAVFSAAFGAGGKEVFVGTDGGEDKAFIIKLEAATGNPKAVYQELQRPRGLFESLRVAGEGKTLIADINAGDHNELRILETKTMGLKDPPDVPLGAIRLGHCSKTSQSCPITVSVPDTPKDIFMLDLKTNAITPARKETRPDLEKLPKLVTQIVKVPSTDAVQVPVILYHPAGLPEGTKIPVIVGMHGGPASSSQVSWNPMRTFYISRGYAFVEPNVRGSSGFGREWEMADNGSARMKSIEDMGSVAQWVARQSWADPKRLVVYGGSYGGYMVLMGLAFQSDLWAAGVDFVGVSSIRTLVGTTSGSIRELLITEFGNVETEGGFLDYVSPLTHANAIVDPLFVYQGENDARVPRSESDQIVGALVDRGIRVEYMIAPQEGHSIDRRESKLEFLSRSARFLEEILGP
jgi:protease II